MIKIPGMRTVDLPLTGGVDEISPVNKIDMKNALKMENFRISKDGKRVEKRLGLAEEVVAPTTWPAEDVYGYTTYYDTDAAFCQLAILESEVWRKVGSAAWAKIHDFAVNVAHPVRPLEIQGKIFVIHENDSRMVHHDKADYQIGITAPLTLPTVATTYPTEDTLPLNDTFAYAVSAPDTELTAIWADGDAGNGQSTMVASGPTTQGPDAHALYLKLTASSISSTSVAKRSITTTTASVSFGSKFTIEFNAYFDTLGTYEARAFLINAYTGAFRVPIVFMYGNMYIKDSKGNIFSFTPSVPFDVWSQWKFVVDGTNSTAISVSAYKDGVSLKTITYSYLDTTNADLIELIQNNKSGNAVRTTYVDNLKITTTSTTSASSTSSAGTPGEGEGAYRYAVTYFRSGNYGCESNPTKSIVGAATFTGVAGHDDVDTGGTYTGASTKTFRVQIDANGTPDTIKWSEDAGVTWKATTIPLIVGTIYLSYGITLVCTATTGHTVGDYWAFTCTTFAATPVGQIVNLTSIPVSSDAQVTAAGGGRKLYRTTLGGSKFYWLATIYNNTTTTFTDNIPDLALGAELEEDRDVAPNGKFSAWWDERLWISGDDIIYYSDIIYPEHFDISDRYVTVQRGDASDEITQLVPYKDSLYVFRKRSIYVIQKTSEGYGIFLVTADVGCIAPFSMVDVNNMLMFLSHRGFELFNGSDVYGLEPSLPIDRTVKTIDMTKTDYVCGMHYPEKREVWWSVPDRLASAVATTIVYHYLADAWYFFSFDSGSTIPSCLVSCYNSSKALVAKMGTRDGYLYLCESGYLDDGPTGIITATYRKPWVEAGEVADIRRVDCEYEIPAAKALTVNIYVNFDKDVHRTDTMVGETIAATDIELRRPHLDFSELGQRAKYVSIELTNAENLGGELKINEITLYLRDRAIKGKIYGD